MKKVTTHWSALLLPICILVIILVAFFVALNQQIGSVNLVSKPAPTSSNLPENNIFGRVVNKDPNEFVKLDAANKKSVFDNGSISLVFDPSKFEISKFDLKDAPSGSGVKMEKIIVQSKTGEYSMAIQLKLDGIGGGCPDFPKGYSLSEIKLSGQSVTKAKYIDMTDNSEAWPVGRIYLVGKNQLNGQPEWYCPNVAGLESPKNGASWIVYNLEKLPLNNSAYKNAEKSLDEIVSSISGFW